jgi:Sap, sulfolipid-1-addressing protein
MVSVLAKVLPIALAMALSTVPLTATLLLLLSPRGRRSSVTFMIGWLVGLTAVVVLFGGGASALPLSTRRTQATAIAAAELVIGTGLVILGLVTWYRSRSRQHSALAWLERIGAVGPVAALGIGLLLTVRPKGLLLGAAAGLALASQPLHPGQTAAVVVVYVVVSASTVTVPILLTLATPNRMEPRLVTWRTWLDDNGRLVTSIAVILLGAAVVAAGLVGLFG